MMNLNQNKQCFVLEPGKKIEYLEGEILSIQLSQWGITGKLKVENESYYYKLKDLDMMKYMLIGMDLIIYNGFCFKNKKGDVVITDGKFGKTDVQIAINRYYNKKENENAIITGIVKSINNASSAAKIEIEQLFPFKKNYYCLISDEEKGKFNNIMEQRVFLIGKIAKLNISYQNQERFLELLEILPEDHFWYKFNEIEKGCSENISHFVQIISNQKRTVEDFYEILKDLFLNTGKDISMNLLIKLKDLLYSKIFDGDLKFPYNILMQKKEIEKYLDSLIIFFRNFIISNPSFNKSEDILNILEYYYSSVKCPDYALQF